MAAYVIVDIGLKNAEDMSILNDYAEKTTKLLNDAGVTVKVFDPAAKVLEGEWTPRMIVVQEYPDMAAVEAFYKSPAYAPLKELRQRIADANVIAVNGL